MDSWPHLNLITCQGIHLQIPAQWEVRASNMNSGRQKHLVHNKAQCKWISSFSNWMQSGCFFRFNILHQGEKIIRQRNEITSIWSSKFSFRISVQMVIETAKYHIHSTTSILLCLWCGYTGDHFGVCLWYFDGILSNYSPLPIPSTNKFLCLQENILS